MTHLTVSRSNRGHTCFRVRKKACVVNSKSVQRPLILVLAVSLVGLGPVPLSACALLTSKLAECATPKAQSQCDQMNMNEIGTQLVAASDTSCCVVSNAPVPQLQYKASNLSLAAPIAVLDLTIETPHTRHLPLVLIVQDISPPSVQSLLCTLLI